MNTTTKISILYVLLCCSTSIAYSHECETYLQKARTLCTEKKYEEAKKQYELYKICNPNADVEKEINDCKESNGQQSVSQTPISIEGGINAKTAPQLSLDRSYELRKVSDDKLSVFKIVIPRDGNLTLSLESFAEKTYFALYNEDGVSFRPTNENIISGRRGFGLALGGFDRRDNVNDYIWNNTAEKFKGSITFKLDAGTYYLRLTRSQTGLSKVNLFISLKDLD